MYVTAEPRKRRLAISYRQHSTASIHRAGGCRERRDYVSIENYRSDLVWRTMRSDSYLRQGLERAGFSGG